MKNVILSVVFACLGLFTCAQNIEGNWTGVIKVQNTAFKIVFHISNKDGALTSKMDSPDQGSYGINLTTTSFQNSTLIMELPAAKLIYQGNYQKDSIAGKLTIAGQSFELNLKRGVDEQQRNAKPQEPTKPYPYITEDVGFENKKENINLAGTLTMPAKQGVYPCVILISGSGPQNRDGEIFGHKPFLVLSDFLTRNGFAVLRFDDRGTGKSTGDFNKATSLDFGNDVLAAVKYLKARKEISSIGLIGHSEGGLIAPIVASQSADISFIILLAGPALQGNKLSLLHTETLAKKSGTPDSSVKKILAIKKKAFDIVIKDKDTALLRRRLKDFFSKPGNDIGRISTQNRESYINAAVNELSSSWIKFFLTYDPYKKLSKLSIPVLSLTGSKDCQVNPEKNLEVFRRAFKHADNNAQTAIILPGLNHLFQECSTGLPEEYAVISQTFSPAAMDEILKWLVKQTK